MMKALTQTASRKRLISPVDPCSAWTAKANKRVQFGYGLNYRLGLKPERLAADTAALAKFLHWVIGSRLL
jgi:hypothetical protein